MTEVRARYLKGGECSLTLLGHATGSEKVCAAISGLVYSLLGYLANDKRARVLYQRVTDGDVCLIWRGRKEALAAWRMACIGFLQLEEAEPKYIKTDIDEKIFKNFSEIGA